MAANEPSICNLALGKLGEKRIMALSDSSQAARFCTLFYEQTRDEILRSHAWNFATSRATLSELAAAPAFGWENQFALPSDCLRVLQLNGYEELQARDLFEIEGRNLLTDEDTAEIKYTARITDANQFDPLFIAALASLLASKLCVPLTGARSQAATLLEEYEKVISGVAKKMDAKEGRPKRKPLWVESDLVNRRFSSDIG